MLSPAVAVAGLGSATSAAGLAASPAVGAASPLAVIRQVVAAGGMQRLYTGAKSVDTGLLCHVLGVN